MWTLAEASVECRVMSGATATSADETSYAEKCEGAWGRDSITDGEVAEVKTIASSSSCGSSGAAQQH